MQEIPLSDGIHTAFVDDQDYPLVSQYKWHVHWARGKRYCYASANVRREHAAQFVVLQPASGVTKYTRVMLHRMIMRTPHPVDHKDGNALNCTRDNMRNCTFTLNSANRRKKEQSSSIYKGVTWVKKQGKWRAHIARKYIGHFISEIDAAKAYDAAALARWGEFAKLNLPTT